TDWPKATTLTQQDSQLIEDMKLVRKIVEQGLSARKSAGIKVRQSLAAITVIHPALTEGLSQLIKDELNIKEVIWKNGEELSVELDTKLDEALLAEGKLRELMRTVQDLRKVQGARLDQKIILTLPEIPEDVEGLKRQVLATDVKTGSGVTIELV
ncbi:MAG: DUF5915 domain-containing protein, partial [Patescibacteria group bacterium]